MKELSIQIPAYNELESLKMILPELLEFAKQNNSEVIIIDDGSTDGTAEYFEKNYNGRIELKTHSVNKGYGAALKKGIECSTKEYIVNFDGDGQHCVADIEKLFTHFCNTESSMVVGKREGINHSTSYKIFGKKIIRAFITFAFRKKIPVSDINSGFKIFSKEKALKVIRQCPDSMAFSECITILFTYSNFKISEVPVSADRRLNGQSKANTVAAFHSLFDIFKLSLTLNPVFVIINLFVILALLILAVFITVLLL